MTRAPRSEWTLVHLIRRQAAAHGNRPFVRFEDGQAFTFRSLDRWSDELAGSLAALGVRAGDRVLGLIGNRAEAIGMLFAVVKLGAIWVPLNTGLRAAFLQHQLHNAEPRVVVVEDRLAANLSDVAASPVPPETLIVVGDPATPAPASGVADACVDDPIGIVGAELNAQLLRSGVGVRGHGVLMRAGPPDIVKGPIDAEHQFA